MTKPVQFSKKYTKKQLQEAISYWKNKLKALNEAEENKAEENKAEENKAEENKAEENKAEENKAEENKAEENKETSQKADDVSGAVKTVDEDQVQAKAKSNPVGDFDLAARMHRLHRGASKKVVTELGKFLNKYNAANHTGIQIENSCDDGDYFKMPAEGDQMVVTIKVDVDQAHVKGFRKMIALMKENDEEIMNEGFLRDLWNGFKKGAGELKKVGGKAIAAMGKTAQEKINNANEKLKKQVGMAAMKMYFASFCGKRLSQKVSLKNIAIGQDEDGTKGAQITFACSVNIK